MNNKKTSKIVKYILLSFTIFLNLFIVISGFIDGQGSIEQASPIISFVNNLLNSLHNGIINESNEPIISFELRKILGHFSLCGFSGIFTTLSFIVFLDNSKFKKIRWSILFSFISGILISCLSEFGQLFHTDRVSSFNDVIIDFSGYLIGCLFVILVVFLLNIVWEKNKNENL